MKIAVITSGFLPVPPSKGGAVENLLYNLIKENEVNEKFEFEVFSIYNEEASKIAKEYKKTKFQFIKTNKVVEFCDLLTFYFAKNILKKENSQSYRFIFQRLFYLKKVSKALKLYNYDKILLENHPTQYLALKWKKITKSMMEDIIIIVIMNFQEHMDVMLLFKKPKRYFVLVNLFLKKYKKI